MRSAVGEHDLCMYAACAGRCFIVSLVRQTTEAPEDVAV